MFDTKDPPDPATGTLATMEFMGRVFFKYDCGDAWLFYRFVRAVAEQGSTVALSWVPMPTTETELASTVHLGLTDPEDQGRFFHAMFGLIHLEGADPADPDTVKRALDAAHVTGVPISIDRDRLDAVAAELSELGVTSSPSLYRHGPVTAITLNPAVLQGDVTATASSILAIADNDGVWELRKP